MRRSSIVRLSLLGALFLGACRHGPPPPAAIAPSSSRSEIAVPPLPVFPADWRFRPGRHGVEAPSGMVVSNSDLASIVGAEIMKRGGNAVDAAVAVGFALTVTYPVAGNIGGGGFMVIRMADGHTEALDYREVAPLAATRDMYLDANGKLTDRSIVGHLAVGVPGAVAGMAEALRKYGTMPLRDVLQPAIRLAADGFVVDSAMSLGLAYDSALLTRYAAAGTFYPGGHRLAAGALLRQPDLARTLTTIAEEGPKAFYSGTIADLMVAEMKRGGGIITKEDLSRYAPIWREAIRGRYRGYTLLSMPPSSSGGVTMIEALNILEGYDKLPPFESAQYRHLFAEAFRRAFVDRNTKLGDPAFVSVPVGELTDKTYAQHQRQSIAWDRATATPKFSNSAAIGMHTTSYSVVDASGNAVATTTTLNNGYGSGVFVTGGGFFLNDEMDDFAAQPGKPNMFGLIQGESNAIAPGKRMLSAMTPTVVLDPQGRLLLVVG
ncbi:MAG: gamma-glutamyltransferase, partial [Gemmatimonadota bacterium]|nr:gamma-glutamyltransferase [Gemmatimonadota bacterium]